MSRFVSPHAGRFGFGVIGLDIYGYGCILGLFLANVVIAIIANVQIASFLLALCFVL